MGRRQANPIELVADERTALERVAKARSASRRNSQRATVVLLAADGSNDRAIGEKLGLSLSTVHRWRTRFVEDRLNGLVEKPRRGRPRAYTDDDRERVVNAVHKEAPPREATRWTVRSLAEHTGIAKDTVHRILREEDLAPHRLTTWAPALAGATPGPRSRATSSSRTPRAARAAGSRADRAQGPGAPRGWTPGQPIPLRVLVTLLIGQLTTRLFGPVLSPVAATAGVTAGVFRRQGDNNLVWKFTALVATFTMIGTVIVPRVPVTLALFTETVTVGSNAFTTAASFGTDVTFTSTSDSYVNEKKSTTNYGTDASMIVESRNANDKRAFVQFDVSSIPGTATVSTATLTLCTTAVTGGRTYNVHRVTSSWTQTGVTWVAQPTVAASATDSLVTPSTAGCMTWTVTADVQAWVDGSAVNNGLRVSDSVESVGGPGAGANDYRTLEDTAVPAEQPKLDVSYS